MRSECGCLSFSRWCVWRGVIAFVRKSAGNAWFPASTLVADPYNVRMATNIRQLCAPFVVLAALLTPACVLLSGSTSPANDRVVVPRAGESAPAPPQPAARRPRNPAPATQATTKEFIPDRRPVRAIPCFNGEPRNPLGLQYYWSQNDRTAFDWFDKQLTKGLGEGFTRFVVILPAGRLRAERAVGERSVPMGSSQWEPQSAGRKFAWRTFLPRWLAAHPGCTVGVYLGFDIDPEPNDVNFSNHRIPDVRTIDDVRAMKQLAAPWLDIGMTEVWWDAASKIDRRAHAMALAPSLRMMGMRAGGEAMPRLVSHPNALDPDAIEAMPWMALIEYHRKWDPTRSWRVDPETTELFIGLRGGENATDAELRSAFERGFIPWTYAPGISRSVMRVWRSMPESR